MQANGGRKIFQILDHGFVENENDDHTIVLKIEWNDKTTSWEYLPDSFEDSDQKIEQYLTNVSSTAINRQNLEEIPMQYRALKTLQKKIMIDSEKEESDLIVEWLRDQYHKKANSYINSSDIHHDDYDTIVTSMLKHLLEKNNTQPILIVVTISQMEMHKKILKTHFSNNEVLCYSSTRNERISLFNNSKKRDLSNPSKIHYTYEICLTTLEFLIRDSNLLLEIPWQWCFINAYFTTRNIEVISQLKHCPILLSETSLPHNDLQHIFNVLHSLNSDIFTNYNDFREEFSEFPDLAEQLLKPYMWNKDGK